jgi:hypothetical protein
MLRRAAMALVRDVGKHRGLGKFGRQGPLLIAAKLRVKQWGKRKIGSASPK